MTENKPLTAVQTLKLLTPDILRWKRDARFIAFSRIPELALDGKEPDWAVDVYSARANMFAVFEPGKPLKLEKARDPKIKQSVNYFLDLERIDEYRLLDSDWLARKLVEMGLPLEENEHIRASVAGGVDLLRSLLAWNVHYSKGDTTSPERWALFLDMRTGETLFHSRLPVYNPPASLPDQPVNAIPENTGDDIPKSLSPSVAEAFKVLKPFGYDPDHITDQNGEVLKSLRPVVKAYARAKYLECPVLEEQDAQITSVAFSPDGRFLATGSLSMDGKIRLWEVATRRPAVELAYAAPVSSFKFTPDGKYLAIAFGAPDFDIKLVELETKAVVKTFSGLQPGIFTLDMDPMGELLVCASTAKDIRLWEIASGRERVLSQKEPHSAAIRAIAFSPVDRILASGSYDGTVKLWDVLTGELLHTFEFKGREKKVESLAYSPDGKFLACGLADGTIRLLATATYQEIKTLRGHPLGYVYCLAFSPDGRFLASAGIDKIIQLWETTLFKNTRTLALHSIPVRSLAFSPDSTLLASAGRDKVVKLCPVRS
ncbi:MAG TPA: WD40 repeat domain-containing protein [Chloroflexia bacterium]|nr:WD40 repeat domain-containing protein [Chloroflexia bacterium]